MGPTKRDKVKMTFSKITTFFRKPKLPASSKSSSTDGSLSDKECSVTYCGESPGPVKRKPTLMESEFVEDASRGSDPHLKLPWITDRSYSNHPLPPRRSIESFQEAKPQLPACMEDPVRNVVNVLWLQNPTPIDNPGYYTGPARHAGQIPHGSHGHVLFDNGDQYNGAFHNGQMHGTSGVYTTHNGSVYKGAFEKNKRHGHGKHSIGGVLRFDGNYERGVPSGYGKSFHANGSLHHDGQWENGKPSHTMTPFQGDEDTIVSSGQIAADVTLDGSTLGRHVSMYDPNRGSFDDCSSLDSTLSDMTPRTLEESTHSMLSFNQKPLIRQCSEHRKYESLTLSQQMDWVATSDSKEKMVRFGILKASSLYLDRGEYESSLGDYESDRGEDESIRSGHESDRGEDESVRSGHESVRTCQSEKSDCTYEC